MHKIDFIYKPKESRIWRWKYRHEAEDGRIEDMSLGTSDKQVAERRRSDWLREKEHERGGLIPAEATREAAQRKLADHLEDFVGDLQRLGKAEKYLANTWTPRTTWQTSTLCGRRLGPTWPGVGLPAASPWL